EEVRQLGAVLDVEPDRLVAQLVHKVCFPIPLQSWWVERIEHALESGLWDGANEVQRWRELLADRFERGLGLLHGSGVAPDHPTHLPEMEMLGKGWSWR